MEILLNKGFSRLIIEDQFYTIESLLDKKTTYLSYDVLIDRGVVSSGDESFNFKIIEVCKEGFFEGGGRITVTIPKVNTRDFSNKFELDGIAFIEPTLNLFSFNNPYGACSGCGGFGNVLGFDKSKIIPNESLSLYSNCIVPWRTEKMKVWLKPLIENNKSIGVDIHKPYFNLSERENFLELISHKI